MSEGFVRGLRPCVRCTYDLRGLALTSNCPECGLPVADSLRGILLQYAASEYIRAIRTGFTLILTGIAISIVLMLAGMALGVVASVAAVGGGIPGVTRLQLLLEMLMGGVYLIILVGYVRATSPDPGYTGAESPRAARRVVRAVVVIQGTLQVLYVLLSMRVNHGIGPLPMQPATYLFYAVSFLSFIAWSVQFFAMMRYVRWLGARVPDSHIIRRCTTYSWLLPLLTTVGVLAVGLGPLIALIMYWNLLDRVRKHLQSIERSGTPANLPRMLA